MTTHSAVSRTVAADRHRASRAAALMQRTPVREVIPYDPRFSTRWHRHDYPSPIARWNLHPEYEIHLITQGTGTFIVGDRVGTFAPGHLAMIGPDLPHHWISDLADDQVIVGRDEVLQFQGEWLAHATEVMPELADLRTLLQRSSHGIEFLGSTALRGAQLLSAVGESTGTRRLVDTLALLAVLAMAPPTDQRILTDDWLPLQTDQDAAGVVNRTLDYIFTNVEGAVRLDVAARMIGMSESAFSRYFKRASGHTFSEIVRRIRIASACKHLDATSAPVSEIAQTVGYRNLSNFNRQFHAETGLTPSEWRRRPTP